MKQLFKRRLSNHLLHMAKYLKYVFNDFFVLALIFLVGGLGLAYSSFLKTLRPGTWWLPLLIGLIMLISVQLGRLATLTQKPDYVFLLPTDGLMKNYFNQALKYSDFNASVIQIGVWFVTLPLIRIQYQLAWPGLISWLMIMLFIKLSWLTSRVSRGFQSRSWIASRLINDLVEPLIVIVLGLVVSPWLGLALALVWAVVLTIGYRQITGPVDWLTVIRSEDHRMHAIYTIFNMFVDVPNFGSTVSRRRYLDPLLRLIPLKRINTYRYLYWHGFVRDKEFSNLYLRLVLIGVLILVFMNGTAFPIVMGLVFVYLIVFQIIPFYYHFENNAFVHIYPLRGLNQLKSFQKMLWPLMIGVETLFLVSLLINVHSLLAALALLVLMTAEVYGMVNVYLPRQVKKNQWKDN